MKLYYSPGACSLAPHIALRAAGAKFEIEKVDNKTKKTETGADYLAVTPKGYVPALRLDSGEVLTEVPAVLQYIADAYPKAKLAPAHATVARAKLHEQLSFISSELHKSFSPFFAATPLTDATRPTAVAGVGKRLDILNADLADGRVYLLGDTFTVADSYFFTIVNWTNFVNIDIKPWPHVAAYMQRTVKLPAVQAALKAEGLLK